MQIIDRPCTSFADQNKISNAAKVEYGNTEYSQYDLVKDGAFKGLNIAVLQFYAGEGFDFAPPQKPVEEKGFVISRWVNEPPWFDEFKKQLQKSCQLWVISDTQCKLRGAYIELICDFFARGRGFYIWGDNHPYYADGNAIFVKLFNASMAGCVQGEQIIQAQVKAGAPGFVANHPVTTGLEFIYEGHTIATIAHSTVLKPLIYGSANNLVAGIYSTKGMRAIVDGGSTRLFIKWDTAGTGKFVKTAAAWLVNCERYASETATECSTFKNSAGTIVNKFNKASNAGCPQALILPDTNKIINRF